MSYKSEGSNKYYVIDIMRAVACVFIFHYHCNTFLPGEWKFLTLFGQDLGNNIFFMVSGFALYPSIASSVLKELPVWYWRRLKRLLPLLILAYALTYLTGFYSFGNPAQLFAVFIYPTLYWFVSAILVFYIVLFLLAKLALRRARVALCLLCFVGYQVFMDNQISLYFIGLASMIAGHLQREWLEGMYTEETHGLRDLYSSRVKAALSVTLIGIGCYAIGKTLLERGEYAFSGHLITGASVLTIGLSALALGYMRQDALAAFFEDKTLLYSIVNYIGRMALPVYLVQCFLTGYIGYWIGMHIDFPMSYPVNLAVVWGIASILMAVDIKLFHTFPR